MIAPPPSYKNISDLQSALIKGAITSEALVSHYLKRINKLNPKLNAFIQVYADDALAAAKELDLKRKNGIVLSPLHGIPIAIKDLVDIKGRVTTLGSPLYKEVAHQSADIIYLLEKAGLIIIGKTHTVQFALGAWGNNEHMDTPKNPWDLLRHLTPGGSSSGSAVAVSAGLVPLSIGTDTGGSIRIPAALCSITGMKTSIKRISTRGIAPLSKSLDTIGMFAKDAAPLIDLFQILSDTVQNHKSQDNQFPINQMRFGRLHVDELRGVHPEILDAYENSIDLLKGLGAEIETIKMPFTFESVAKVSSTIMLTEAAKEYGQIALDSTKEVDSSVRPRLITGTQITETDYVNALSNQASMKLEFERAITNLDAVLTPCSLTPPIPIDEVNHDRPPVRYTRLVNLLDMCGISIPNGFDKEGLPLGLQIAGRTDEDEKILVIAKNIQLKSNFHTNYPEHLDFYSA